MICNTWLPVHQEGLYDNEGRNEKPKFKAISIFLPTPLSITREIPIMESVDKNRSDQDESFHQTPVTTYE